MLRCGLYSHPDNDNTLSVPLNLLKSSQIPSDLVVNSRASSVESRSILDFLCIHYA
jgi:hypothetical protein